MTRLVNRVLPVLIFGLFSCGSKQDVALDVSASSASLVKSNGPFGAKLDGSVTLTFSLGNFATENIQVDGVQLGLYKGVTTTPLLGDRGKKLTPVTGSPAFPLKITPGQQVVIKYELTISQLTNEETTELCSAGQASYGGLVTQTGKTESARIGTSAFAIQGCP